MSDRITRILKENVERRKIREERTFEELLEEVSDKLDLITEQRGNASIEGVITKLRGKFRSNELMTFRQWLDEFSNIIG